MPTEVRLFPVSRSSGRVAALADAIDLERPEDCDAAWRREFIALGRQLLDQGVPDRRVDIELVMLLDAAKSIIAQRRAMGIPPQRSKAEGPRQPVALRLVALRPVQLDLFDMKPEPAKALAPNAGEMAHVG